MKTGIFGHEDDRKSLMKLYIPKKGEFFKKIWNFGPLELWGLRNPLYIFLSFEEKEKDIRREFVNFSKEITLLGCLNM